MESGSDVPASVKRILETEGIFVPDNLTEEQAELFEFARAGHCMTCNGELGDATMLIVVKQGVVGVFCGGRCMGDMQIFGWLREQLEDLQDRIAFRGDIDADAPEDEDGTDD